MKYYLNLFMIEKQNVDRKNKERTDLIKKDEGF